MCTNFTPTQNSQWVKQHFGIDLPTAQFPLETYPGYAAPIVVQSQQTGRKACGLARFGLIPGWAKDEKISRHTYNARAETVSEKPSYRTAWRQRRFGIAVLDNFLNQITQQAKLFVGKLNFLPTNLWELPAFGILGLTLQRVKL